MKTTINLGWMHIALILFLSSCHKNNGDEKKGEHLVVHELTDTSEVDSLHNSVTLAASFKQIPYSPNMVRLTGLDHVRLLPIYKIPKNADKNIVYDEGSSYYDSYDERDEDDYNYFMPGIDLINGYNLINVGHYNITNEKLTYFFTKPVLIKSLYFPGVKNDSLHQQPVKRDFFLLTVYDEDTNHDSFLNKKDMRKLFYINQDNSIKKQLIPKNHSAIRSTYDYKNDIMYVYCRYDSNKNGSPEKKEPIHIFWLKLDQPDHLKKMI